MAGDFESGQARAELRQLEAAYGIRVEVRPEEDLRVPGRGDLQLRYVSKGEGP